MYTGVATTITDADDTRSIAFSSAARSSGPAFSPWKMAGANVTRSISSSVRYGVPSSDDSSSATDAAATAVREPALGLPTTVTTDCGHTGGSGTTCGSNATEGI